MVQNITIGVIISTYNNPAWLEKTLWGYLCQDRMADEIIIAIVAATADYLVFYRSGLCAKT